MIIIPRYGAKTLERVKRLIDIHAVLRNIIDITFHLKTTATATATATTMEIDDSKKSIAQCLQDYIQNEKEHKEKRKQQEMNQQLQLKSLQKQTQNELEQQLKQKEEMLQLKQEQERLELNRKAEEARILRIENERRAKEDEIRADEAFLSSVNVGLSSVKDQLQTLRESCCAKDEFDIALRSLHTIFKQITSRPEEIQFRRIRRDHQNFVHDIGRHEGGKELLIAAGFTFQEIDEKKCFFSAEPDLATDMDGWSSWFDLMKGTFQLLDETLAK